MELTEIETIVIAVVTGIQEISGRAAVPVSRDTRPVTDLPDFDSLNGVEATVDVLGRLGIELDLNNLFVDEDTPLTVGEVAQRLRSALHPAT